MGASDLSRLRPPAGGSAASRTTAPPAPPPRWTGTRVTNTARAASVQHDGRDEWARGIISVYARWEFATVREQADIWFSRHPHSKGPASDIIRQFLSDARAQLTDTTLGPARPHALADFGPHLVTTDAERTCILTSVPVPADDERRTEMHRAARRRQSQGRALVLLTVYALDARSAEAVVYTDHHLARYRADRSGLSR